MRQIEVAVPASAFARPSERKPFWMSWPSAQIAPPMKKAKAVSLNNGVRLKPLPPLRAVMLR